MKTDIKKWQKFFIRNTIGQETQSIILNHKNDLNCFDEIKEK